MLRRLLAALCMCGLLSVAGLSVEGAETRPILTASAAMKMIHACLAMAQSEGWLVHIAIIDNSGLLKAYYRMDDTRFLGQEVVMGKARSAAVSPRSSGQWGEAAFPNGGGPTAVAFLPGVTFFEGGLPIMTADGYHVGGIGVSGDSGENDARCAQAGIDAAADDLQ